MAGLTEIVTTTLRHRKKAIADATTRNNGIMYELRRRKRIEMIGGGRTISCPIMYGETDSFMFYQGKEALDLSDEEALTSAEFNWKQWAVGVSISGLEQMQNSGAEQIIPIMKHRIMKAEKTLANNLSASVYSDGSSSAGKEIGGLNLLNGTSNASGTVGGIPVSSTPWWQNVVRATGGVTVSTIYDNMLALCLDLQRDTDKTNLIMADNSYCRTYQSSLRPDQRFRDPKLANAGFRNIQFEGIPVIADGKKGGFAPVGMHFLNLETLSFVMRKQRNNVVLSGAAKRPITEDSDNVIMAGMGNMTTNNRYLNGRLID